MLMHSLSIKFTFLRYGAVAAIACCSAGAVAAQAAHPTPEPAVPRLSRSDDPDTMTSMEEEMRAKRAIKYAEKEYRENLDRAHELADLGSQLSDSFKKKQQFDREDLKKLDRLEKLARAIRNAAGGSDSEKDPDKHSVDLAVNLKKMLAVVESLADRVEKTPRHVISAAVIDEANVLLELIRSVRELSSKA
jgi:Skp family chaperone for outer membrane proteins